MIKRWGAWGLGAVSFGIAVAIVVSCVGDSAGSDGLQQGGAGDACYQNGTCNAGLECRSNVCVDLGDGGSGATDGGASSLDGMAPAIDGSISDGSTADGSTTMNDAQATVCGADAAYCCDRVDAAYCEDFDHGHTVNQIGSPNIAGNGQDAAVEIDLTNPIAGPASLTSLMSGGTTNQSAVVYRSFTTTLGTFTSISIDADFRCTVPTSEVAGAPVGFIFADQANQNGHQVFASLYPNMISIDEGVTTNGTLTGTGKGVQLAFQCGPPAVHHITIALTTVGGPSATLTLDGTTGNTPLSTTFQFDPYVTLLLGLQNAFNGTTEALTLDNVIVLTH